MESAFFQPDVRNSPEFSNVKEENAPQKTRKKRDYKEVNGASEPPEACRSSRVKEVVIFFEDGTYQKFSSELKK
jgi:hypothetical protein